MTVRWTVRTANDRGALRTENRVLFEAPKEKRPLTEWSFFFCSSWSFKSVKLCFGSHVAAVNWLTVPRCRWQRKGCGEQEKTRRVTSTPSEVNRLFLTVGVTKICILWDGRTTHRVVFFLADLIITCFLVLLMIVLRGAGREITGQTQKYILYCIYRYGR